MLLGDLHWSNRRSVLAEVKVSQPGVMPGAPPPAPTPLVGFALTYNTKDAGPTTVTGAANVSFVSSRVQLPAEDGDVAAAAAIQTAADADAECLRLIGRGEQAAAVAKKEASIETLSALLRELGKEPRYRDSCCVRLAQVRCGGAAREQSESIGLQRS